MHKAGETVAQIDECAERHDFFHFARKDGSCGKACSAVVFLRDGFLKKNIFRGKNKFFPVLINSDNPYFKFLPDKGGEVFHIIYVEF